MSALIIIENFGDANHKEASFVGQDVAAAATSITAESGQGFESDLFVLVENPTSEFAEIKQIDSVSSNAITLSSPLLYAHRQYSALTVLYCDKLRIYRALNVNGTAPVDADFTLIDTIDIDPDQADSQYVDPAGSSDYWYKFTYYNSVNLTETSIAATTAARGGGVTDYCSISDIRDEAGLSTNKHISDSLIARKRLEAQGEINSTLTGLYTIPFTAPVNILIDTICCKLAAGFLLVKNYGTMSTLNTNNGDSKIKEARGLLEELNTRKKTLIDESGTDISIATGLGLSIYPDASTATNGPNDGGGERMFRVSDIQGFEGRLY